jgi:deazaflavin-dependent oxidoreductase (nitroreductase family)
LKDIREAGLFACCQEAAAHEFEARAQGGFSIMAGQIRSARVPWFVPLFNPIARCLLAAGVPMGPNVLVTIRGRKSGLPRTTPLTIVEFSSRRWLMAPYGEVNWVRNLRAAGRATIVVGRRKEEVIAVELEHTEAVAFFQDVLGPRVQRTRVGAWIVQHIDQVDLNHPEDAARGRPVFELSPLQPQS